jgi:hypothetical protein
MTVWNRDMLLLVALTALFALLLLVHVFMWLRSWRSSRVPKLLRWFTWLPPLACVADYWVGARVVPAFWCIVLVVYLVLRSQA